MSSEMHLTFNCIIVIFVFVGGPTGDGMHYILNTNNFGEWKKYISLYY